MHQPKYLLAYCSLRISITMCEAKGERFFTMFRMTKQRFIIGEFISVTMNEPMFFCFVIDEFCSNRSNVA